MTIAIVLSKVSREIVPFDLAFRLLHRSPAAEYLFGSWLFQHNCQRTRLHYGWFYSSFHFFLLIFHYSLQCFIYKSHFSGQGLINRCYVPNYSGKLFQMSTSVTQWFSLLLFPCFLFYTHFTLSKVCLQSKRSQHMRIFVL